MPPDTIFTKKTEPADNWYNTISILRLSPTLYSDISSIMADLQEVVGYITTNHMLYVQNCGHDYLPSKIKDEKSIDVGIFYGIPLEDEGKNILNEIITKLHPNMNYDSITYNFNLQIDNEKIKNYDQKNIINLWKTD